MPLRQELIVASVQLPLPRFSWKESPSGGTDVMSTSGTSLNLLLHQSNGLNPLPPPVADRRNSLPRRSDWQESTTKSALGSRRNSSVNSQREQREQQIAQNSDVQSTDSEVEQNESSGGGGGAGGCTGSSSREAVRKLIKHNFRKLGLILYLIFFVAPSRITRSLEYQQRQPNTYK